MKISKVLLSQCEITSDFGVTKRHVLHAVSIKHWKEICSETKENVINRECNDFDVEYGFYFNHKAEFVIFSLVFRTRENIKKNMFHS